MTFNIRHLCRMGASLFTSGKRCPFHLLSMRLEQQHAKKGSLEVVRVFEECVVDHERGAALHVKLQRASIASSWFDTSQGWV